MKLIDKLLSFSAPKYEKGPGKDGKMHLIKDENGNVIPHGGEAHQENCSQEVVALLNYMLSHNEHHAQELDQMAENLQKLGMEDAAKTIKEGVADFQKGNMRLGLALTLVKSELEK